MVGIQAFMSFSSSLVYCIEFQMCMADSTAIKANNMNKRIRQNGYSSKEILIQRDEVTNKQIKIDDDKLISNTKTARESKHKKGKIH